VLGIGLCSFARVIPGVSEVARTVRCLDGLQREASNKERNSMRTGVFCLFAIAGLVSPILPAATTSFCDVRAISFTPATTNTATASQTVTVSIRIVCQAGFPVEPGLSSLILNSADNRTNLLVAPFGSDPTPCASGEANCFDVTFPVTIARGTSPGNYYPEVILASSGGGFAYFPRATLQANGIAAALTITGASPSNGCVLPGLVPEPPGGGISDTTPPALVGICLSSYTIDTRPNGASVDVTINITDDLSGFDYGWIVFYSPTGNQSIERNFGYWSREAGSATSGIYRVTVQFPATAETGNWTYHLTLYDKVGNPNSSPAIPPDAPVMLAVISTPDTIPPVWASSTIAGAVDVSNSSKTIPLVIRITDNQSGLDPDHSYVQFASPSGKQAFEVFFYTLTLTGTSNDGIWSGNATVQRYSEPGAWKIQNVVLRDLAGNVVYMSSPWGSIPPPPGGFTVTSTPADTASPVFTSFSFSPQFVNTSAEDKSITVRAGFSDSPAGLLLWSGGYVSCWVYFVSPSRNQQHYNSFPFQLIGSANNGIAEGTVVLPRYSELGTWRADALQCRDATLAWTYLDTAALTAKGFPTELIVIQPSMIADGTFDSGHHTIQDSGSNTTLSDPAGQLPNGTTVSIDVLAAPPPVEAPTGFSIGTGFLNVTLTPQPTAPLPPPGLTLVLTLNSQMTPGAELALYKVDPTSGKLVPVPRSGGGYVTGVVNPGGLTATFTGISTFSTVVGLTPPAIPGDLDTNGVVNCADIQLIRNSWGKRVGQASFDPRADYNRDGIVNIFDLAAVSKQLPRGTKCY
jgi:hypothetical protein